MVTEHESAKRAYEASLQGIDIDGGAVGSGLSGVAHGIQPKYGSDPTQGPGSPAWQQALQMGMAINAKQRRN